MSKTIVGNMIRQMDEAQDLRREVARLRNLVVQLKKENDELRAKLNDRPVDEPLH
jgi:hypothetical protein